MRWRISRENCSSPGSPHSVPANRRASNLPHVGSGKDVANYGPAYISQTEVAPAIAVSELLVVQAELVEDGRVQIVDVHTVFDCFKSEIVCAAVCHSALESTAG